MAKHNQSPNQGQQSVKLKAKPLEGPSFKVAEFAVESDVHILSNDNEHAGKKSASEPSKIMSTAELTSAVGQIWDSANRALACLQPRERVHSDNAYQTDVESCYSVADDSLHVLDLVDGKNLDSHISSSKDGPLMVKQSLDRLRLIQEIAYEPCDEQFIRNLFPNLHVSSTGHDGCSKERNLNSIIIPNCLMNSYRWLSHISPLAELPSSTSGVSKKIIDTSEAAFSACYSLSRIEPKSSSYLETKNLESYTDKSNISNLPSDASTIVIMNNREPVLSLHSDYFLKVENTHSVASRSTACEPNRLGSEVVENKTSQLEKLNIKSELESESCVSVTNQLHAFIAKQEHAVSGALAGICVSLCLHPIDTIKTVVQSCQASPMSTRYIGQSIISERGLTGLYRGITTNITASAPISAIYTFTYESVKCFLLPSFSKEYHSVAHCTAGACASIATSFVFTPSEHIKQQMQVNAQYKNCWNAVYRIIEKGGLSSLYSGWCAVLCRNIPHSIIKFYTYESLKQRLLSSEKPNSQPSTLDTLICGGLAGSSAALFSTPFDVVKTRLQTQMPGSIRRYDSILGAFKNICEQEGLKGLYRGLFPRLVMYMSQGALFFASYELFKNLLSRNIPRYKPDTLQNQLDMDDDPLLSL